MAKQRGDADRLMELLLKQQGRSVVPQMSDIAAEAINKLGGTKSIAQAIVSGIEQSPEGSMQHARLITMVMDAVKAGETKAPELSRMEEEDLEKLLRSYVAEYMEATSADAAGPAAGPGVRPQADPGPQAPPAEAGRRAEAGGPGAVHHRPGG